ncbi:MAG TPA: hypothetical protein VF571_09300 [Pyrinomonadaceae bacterium]|jgi:hypothetical protein
MPTKNDVAWETLFSQHNILSEIEQNGIYNISSTTVNTAREARLMAKFDKLSELPKIFRDNNLTILSISRGSYVIGKFNNYYKIKTDDDEPDIVDKDLPLGIETIQPNNIYSESAALLCAFNARIIEDLFDEPVAPTIGGRMKSGIFNFKIQSGSALPEISVKNAQIEIDGGFEGDSRVLLFEAKKYGVTNFLIRQLYYPYRCWVPRTKKPIVPIFMSYSNDIFSFYIFKFEDDELYNSLKLIGRKRYRIAPEEIGIDDIVRVLEEAEASPMSGDVPFPQADYFPRILDLIELIKGEGKQKQPNLTARYKFATRQTQYYTSAAECYGLVKREYIRGEGVFYDLTNDGIKILGLTRRQRNLEIAKRVLQQPIFAKSLRLYFEQGEPVSKDQIAEIMKREGVKDVDSFKTINRRAQSVKSALRWIMELQRA